MNAPPKLSPWLVGHLFYARGCWWIAERSIAGLWCASRVRPDGVHIYGPSVGDWRGTLAGALLAAFRSVKVDEK